MCGSLLILQSLAVLSVTLSTRTVHVPYFRAKHLAVFLVHRFCSVFSSSPSRCAPCQVLVLAAETGPPAAASARPRPSGPTGPVCSSHRQVSAPASGAHPGRRKEAAPRLDTPPPGDPYLQLDKSASSDRRRHRPPPSALACWQTQHEGARQRGTGRVRRGG